jgi:multidrug resistance protein, MATE family
MSNDPEAQRMASKLEKQPLVPTVLQQNEGNIEIEKANDEHSSLWHDAKDTITLGIPIFLAMLSWVGMKTTDSALLGHVSADALAAAALSDLVCTSSLVEKIDFLSLPGYLDSRFVSPYILSSSRFFQWTMCTVVLLNARILGVLCSSAVGAGNPKLAGIYLQVSYYVLAFVLAFVFVCWYFTEAVWTMLGSEARLAKMAGYYAKVLAWSLPGQLAVGQLSQFFSSQRIMHPEVNASSVALVLNLVLGLILVLGIPIPGWNGFGFTACPIVTASVVYVQFFVIYFIYIHIQRLHEPCWGGWAWKEITRERIKTFCELYIPAALGISSDFWRVAVIGIVAAKLGNVEVAVFNTGYRIMWIVLIMVNSLSSAAGIKTSIRLGKLDHVGAKQAGWVGIYMAILILSLIGGFVLWKIRWFGRIFTEDSEFLDLFEEVKWPFTLTLILMNLSVAIERIPYSMGRTKEVFWFGFIASWGAQVPGVILLTKYWRNDLIGLYWGMAIGYLVLTILYGWIVMKSDWQKYAMLARQRSEMSDD